jgi:GTPase SAR1 family protein
MNKDLFLKSNDVKLILLICGDSKTGKKTIVKGIIKDNKFTEKEQTSFKSYFFTDEETVGKSTILIPIELRVLNSDEIDSDLKSNKTFFSEALGAFVVNSITDNNSFTNGEKWKDKIDLMCCLPNRFPLPIFLLINKCDTITNEDEKEENKNLQYVQKDKIESYSLENQFFNTFLLGKGDDDNNIINTEKNDDNKISINNYNKEENIKDLIVSPSTPFKEMVKIILGFKDLRNTFIKQSGGTIDDSEFEHANQNKSKKCNIY